MSQSRVLAATTSGAGAGDQSFSILVASTADEISAAQRLRYAVFGVEMGARLHSPVPGLDVDAFDEFCDHLVVRDDRTGTTIATYRMLPPHKAPGRLYSDGEFDLTSLADLRQHIVETGRSCVHPDHRNGAVITLMWTGIARYLHLYGYRWLAGCASVPLADGGHAAAAVWEVVRQRNLSPERLRVTPRRPYPLGPPPAVSRAAMLAAFPPLLRGYLRLGAWVCGEPALDENFGVADFFVLLSLDEIDPRYLRHYLGQA
jgi:putative hemolysin